MYVYALGYRMQPLSEGTAKRNRENRDSLNGRPLTAVTTVVLIPYSDFLDLWYDLRSNADFHS